MKWAQERRESDQFQAELVRKGRESLAAGREAQRLAEEEGDGLVGDDEDGEEEGVGGSEVNEEEAAEAQKFQKSDTTPHVANVRNQFFSFANWAPEDIVSDVKQQQTRMMGSSSSSSTLARGATRSAQRLAVDSGLLDTMPLPEGQGVDVEELLEEGAPERNRRR